MKSNIAENKRGLALDFIKFVNTDQSLIEFSQLTNTTKALQYTMTEDEMSNMSYFGKSVVRLQQESNIVYPYT